MTAAPTPPSALACGQAMSEYLYTGDGRLSEASLAGSEWSPAWRRGPARLRRAVFSPPPGSTATVSSSAPPW